MAREPGYGTPLENHRWERFVRLFVLGNPERDLQAEKRATDNPPETLNNATQAYLAAGFSPRSSEAAAASASRLLRNGKVLARIAELRVVKGRLTAAFLSRWMTLLPDAQRVLEDSMAGEDISSRQIRSAIHVIRLAQGETRSRSGRAGSEGTQRKWRVFLGGELLYETDVVAG